MTMGVQNEWQAVSTEFNESIKAYVRERLTSVLGLLPGGKFPTIDNKVQAMADQANRGCGQSYDLFVQRFSGMFDSAFPPGCPDRERALVSANGIYATPEELEKAQEELAEMGYCTHGLDPYCCPCGCGDLDY